MTISVIGAGNMGGSLIRGWVKAGIAADLRVSAKTQATVDKFKNLCFATLDNREAVRGADIVVLAVKPWLVDDVIREIASDLGGKTLLSVAAKARNERIDVYAMPNIAAEVGESMTFLSCANDEVQRLFSLVGRTMVVDERQMDAGMMLAGCGIAYAMRYIRACMEAGVEMGLYPKDALSITLQAVQGAVTLLNETGVHPEAAIDRVTTPGGTTIKGLNELDHAGFNSAVIRCMKAGL